MSVSASAALDAALAAAPVVAILRGLTPDDAIDVVEALYGAGIRVAEVPLNSPEPFDSIALLRQHFGDRMVIGAGTVTDSRDVDRLAEVGAQICVAPNCDLAVIARAAARGLVAMPGVASPSEAFRAYEAGARWLKFFPAGEAGLATIAALAPVMPKDARFVAVGGVGAANCAAFLSGGCDAIGVGSELYRPGMTVEAVAAAARALVAAAAALPRVAELVANPGATISESPLLDRTGETLLFVDPVQSALHHVRLSDGAASQVATAVPVNAIGWRGGTLIGLADDAIVELDPATGAARTLMTVDVGSGCRFNDMTIDPDGVIWAGTMHRGLLSARGALFRIDAANRATRVCEGLGVCNGIAMTADRAQLYLIDTLARTLIRFPVTRGGAGVGEPVIVSDFMGLAGKPDGMALDADGHPLVAMWGGAAVVELGADGSLRRRHALPAPHVSSLCVGRAGELLVTSSRMRLTAEVADATGSGGLYRIARAI
jgi:Entner-Doudoroff aldolase